MSVFDRVMVKLDQETQIKINDCLTAWSKESRGCGVGSVVQNNLRKETCLPDDAMGELLALLLEHWDSPVKGVWNDLERCYQQICRKHGLKGIGSNCASQLPNYLWHAKPKKTVVMNCKEQRIQRKNLDALLRALVSNNKKQWSYWSGVALGGLMEKPMWASWDETPGNVVAFDPQARNNKRSNWPFFYVDSLRQLTNGLGLPATRYRGVMWAFSYPKSSIKSPGPLKPTVADGGLHLLFRVSAEACGRIYHPRIPAEQAWPEAVHPSIFINDIEQTRVFR